MKVNDIQSALRGIDPRDAQKTERPKQDPVESEVKSSDGDALQISINPRMSAVSGSDKAAQGEDISVLSSARIREIESRVKSGFYDQPQVAQQTAQNLLDFYAR
jgi:hypothetical protein